MCISCPHKVDCIEAHGSRAGRIPISLARFSLQHEKVAAVPSTESSLQTEYVEAHCDVFKSTPKIPLVLKECEGQIVLNAEKVGCSTKVFFYALMMWYKKVCPSQAYFKSSLLVSDKSVENAKIFVLASAREFGHATGETIGMLLDCESDTLKRRMLVTLPVGL